ncbi:MAG: fold metallo-hydrolase, partial [Solirubrobacterales bacterium]|nr:fold metallo-hydrolase [Solirubrobacterales bacterium]
ELDVLHLGTPKVICCHEPEPGVLVDPGPASSFENLLAALDGAEPRRILLTHIHLDHAGATGLLVRRFPDAEVWVHERGAAHVVDPSRLVASATRLYGDDMDRLWGEIVPVPEANLRVLSGGERLEGFRVEYTPGHASHHVAYLHEASGTALCGDVAGIRIGDGPLIAPTPPPDIDIEAWHDSLEKIAAWRPRRLALTHWGSFTDVDEHLAGLHAELDESVRLAAELDEEGYRQRMFERYAATAEEASYRQAGPPPTLHPGLERYLRKR